MLAQCELARHTIPGNPQDSGKLLLKRAQCPQTCLLLIEMIQGAPQQIVDCRIRMVHLHTRLNELTEVSGHQRCQITPPQSLPPVENRHFPQSMQFTLPRPRNKDFPGEKKVQFPGKHAFRPQCAFGNRFDHPLPLAHPMDNQTRLGETGGSYQDRSGRKHWIKKELQIPLDTAHIVP